MKNNIVKTIKTPAPKNTLEREAIKAIKAGELKPIGRLDEFPIYFFKGNLFHGEVPELDGPFIVLSSAETATKAKVVIFDRYAGWILELSFNKSKDKLTKLTGSEILYTF